MTARMGCGAQGRVSTERAPPPPAAAPASTQSRRPAALGTPPRTRRLAVRKTVNLLHPPLPSAGAPIRMRRGCQQNDSLADGYSPPPGPIGSRLTQPSSLPVPSQSPDCCCCLAVGETVILLHPPLPSVGVSIGMERAGCSKMTVSPTAAAAATAGCSHRRQPSSPQSCHRPSHPPGPPQSTSSYERPQARPPQRPPSAGLCGQPT